MPLDEFDDSWDDEAITQSLTAIKGIGVWTAEMFLIFALNRPDILPASDLGVRVGLRDRHGLVELPRPRDCHALAEPWRPYRTIASWYIWKGADTPIARPSPPVPEVTRDASRRKRRRSSMTFDLILKGGWVIDGSGGPPFRADVAVARHDDRRGGPPRRGGSARASSTRPGATSCPASSTPTFTATSCFSPTRFTCRHCARA